MTRPAPLAMLIPAVLAAAGCAPKLDIRSPVTALPPAFTAAQAGMPIAFERWWTLFGDEQLDQLVTRALQAGGDSRLGLARLREAQAIRQGATASFRVQGDVQVAGGVQRSETLSGPDLLIGGPGGTAVPSGETVLAAAPSFNLSWELDLIGRRGAVVRAAEADLAAARFVYEGTRATLAAEVADTLFTARGLVAQVTEAREVLFLQRRSLSATRARAERGLSSDADAARIDADAAEAEAQVAALEAELTATKRALLVLVGDGDQPVDNLLVEPRLDPPPPTPATLPGELLERRPDVREAEQRVLAGMARAERQRLELFPRFTLNPGMGLTATRSGGVDAVGAAWTLGAGLAAPLLDRARLLSEMRAESARAEQAVIAYERAVQTAFSETDQALVRLAADRARVVMLTRAEAAARQTHDAARVTFARGLTDLSSLLDVQRTHLAARTALASAKTETLRRAVTLFRALGGGWDAASDQKGE